MMISNQKTVREFYQKDNQQLYGDLAKVFIVFAILCLITALMFNTGSSVIKKNIVTPETIGPIESKVKNTVYQIAVRANIPMNSWAQVTGELLDSNQQYLFAFGDELWKESGRDSDGYWTESSVDYEMKVTVPKPGKYYFRFISEQGRSGFVSSSMLKNGSKASIKVVKKRGSSLPHMWAGVIALILAVVFNELKSRFLSNLIETMGEG